MREVDKEFWDESGHLFKGTTPATADNQEVAWPALRRELEENLPKATGRPRILDFGCGSGQLSHLLGANGLYRVVGIDPSAKMISQADEHVTPGVTFVEGTIHDLASMKPFDGIVSSMVFQFVEELDDHFGLLFAALERGGIFSFVVFNPAFISEHLEAKTELFIIDQCGCPQMVLEGRPTPVYSRSAGDYEALLTQRGFEVLSSYVKAYSEDTGAGRFMVLSCTKR
jgi:trans-aconitate methyltransferase